jgi:hypothetical protein
MFFLLIACSGAAKESNVSKDDSTPIENLEPVCTEAVEVACIDEMILDLSLHDDKVSDGAVATTQEGEDFVTTVDASAGGYNQSTKNPWVYVKFTESGAVRVDIDDETALESMDWDMSLRRFIIRLNGGSSGPSCVGAASLLNQNYTDITSIPDGVPYALDDFYTDDCTLINDSSGLPGSPQVAMAPWWEYPGCVATTLTPFLIQLADGHVLKLVVEAYYGEDQAECNEQGSTTAEGGYYTIRWRYLK